MDYTPVINQIIVLFLVMLTGYICNKRNLLNTNMNKGLTEIIIYVTIPAMIISSFNLRFSRDMLYGGIYIFIISSIIHILLIFVSKLFYFKFNNITQNILRFSAIFSNCGFMGYPVVQSIYGSVGVFYAAIYNIPFTIAVWTIGVALYTGGKNDIKSLKKALVNPGIVAVFVGLIIFGFSIKLPIPINKYMDSIGSTTVPLSMLVIGSSLATVELKKVFTGFEVYYSTFIRLIVLPVIFVVLFKVLGINNLIIKISALLLAMPAAANTAIFAERYDGDVVLASKCVFISTLLSAVTIPILVIIMK